MSEEKPKRMMARKDFKVLRRMLKEIKNARRDYQEWAEDLCDKNSARDWWPDKMQPQLGFVLVGKDKRDRIPREVLLEIRERLHALEDGNERFLDKIAAVAMACGVVTTAVNVETGEITTSDAVEANPAPHEEMDDAEGKD